MLPRIPSPPTELRDIVAGSLVLTHRAVLALDDDGHGLDAEKVVGEAFLLLRATRPLAADARVAEAWRSLYDAAAPLARPATLPAALCRDPGRALEAAFAHVQLTDLGDVDPGLDLLLDLAAADDPCGPEPAVVPALQRQWLIDVRRGTPDWPAIGRLVSRSSLARPVDVLRCSTQDVYDLTHAVMHGADLGAWRLTSPRPAAGLVADLDALLGLALDAENLDLTAELLWAWPMLRLPWSVTARLALDVVIGTHRRHGYLPGPGHDPDGGPAIADVLRTSYHATLVHGILAAALVRAGDLGAGVVDAPFVPGGGQEMLAELDGDRSRPWLRAAESLPGHDLDVLAPTLLAVAFRRASDRADLGDVRRLLEVAVRLGLTDGRAVEQATGLLRRGTALARSLQSRVLESAF